jgi:hypothetical protein
MRSARSLTLSLSLFLRLHLDGEKLGGIDGLEMKQIQEELERERKEKEAAQAEVLLLKTKISEIGFDSTRSHLNPLCFKDTLRSLDTSL